MSYGLENAGHSVAIILHKYGGHFETDKGNDIFNLGDYV